MTSEVKIKTRYDKTTDSLFLYLCDIAPGAVHHSVEAVEQRIMLDFDDRDRMLGIEILDARKTVPKEFLARCGR